MTGGRAVLLSVWLPSVSERDHLDSLAEMRRLARTVGLEVVETVTQKLAQLSPTAVVGTGKLRELGLLTGGDGAVPSAVARRPSRARLRRDEDAEEAEPSEPAPPAMADTIIVDNDISPAQIRNLEQATGAQVFDRAGIIIEIFHRHARTREARLQVELARLTYEAPRLRQRPSRGDRGRAGSVGGPGESELELDRRRIRDRMAQVRRELAALETEQGAQRARRREENTVALVGYTNAGKSSLMRALTGSEVLVADQLFATLGSTVRPLAGGGPPRILLSDTVGFIKDLPHDLVASFRSTLTEARAAAVLLLVVDAADPAFRAQLAVTTAVLGDIGVDASEASLVLNKCDLLSAAQRAALAGEFPGAQQVSAHRAQDVEALAARIRACIQRSWQEETFAVPYARQSLVHDLHAQAQVLQEDYGAEGAELRVRGSPEVLARLRAQLAQAGAVGRDASSRAAGPEAP